MAQPKLDQINNAAALQDRPLCKTSAFLPAITSRHSWTIGPASTCIRINRQYRICFEWTEEGATNVEILRQFGHFPKTSPPTRAELQVPFQSAQPVDSPFTGRLYLLTTFARAVNASLTLRNWSIGFHIAEYEQMGTDRAQYGDKHIS